MKKLIIALAVAVFLAASFAQAQTDTKKEAKPAPQASEKKMTTHCYVMKDGAMIHCMGSKTEPMAKDATLKNGTMVSTKGEVTMKDGKKTMLANGQCIDVNGRIGDFDKMHPAMKKADDKSKM